MEAGLDPENPPATWEELKNAALALTEREGDKVVFAGLDIPSLTVLLFLQNRTCAVPDRLSLMN